MPVNTVNVLPICEVPSYIIEINGSVVANGGTYPVKKNASGWPSVTIVVFDANRTVSTTYTLTII